MKLIGVKWFTGTSCIGIVMAECPYDGVVYFINQVTGHDEKADAEYIMSWGTRFPKNAGDVLFGVNS